MEVVMINCWLQCCVHLCGEISLEAWYIEEQSFVSGYVQVGPPSRAFS